MSILEELWYGNLAPMKHMRQSGAHQELTNLIDRNQSELSAMLNEGEKDTLEKLLDCQEELSQVTEREAFLAGFRMGVQIMVDSVQGEDITSSA